MDLAVAAHHLELLSEGELAEVLATDMATARAVYQERHQILLEEPRLDQTSLAAP